MVGHLNALRRCTVRFLPLGGHYVRIELITIRYCLQALPYISYEGEF